MFSMLVGAVLNIFIHVFYVSWCSGKEKKFYVGAVLNIFIYVFYFSWCSGEEKKYYVGNFNDDQRPSCHLRLNVLL